MYIDEDHTPIEVVENIAQQIKNIDKVLKAASDTDYTIRVMCQDDKVSFDDEDDAHKKIINALNHERRQLVHKLKEEVQDV